MPTDRADGTSGPGHDVGDVTGGRLTPARSRPPMTSPALIFGVKGYGRLGAEPRRAVAQIRDRLGIGRLKGKTEFAGDLRKLTSRESRHPTLIVVGPLTGGIDHAARRVPHPASRRRPHRG